MLAERSNELFRKARRKAGETQVRAGDLFGKGREHFEEQTQRLASAFETGQAAMKEEMLRAQQMSSDRWSFYQAKAIREHQCLGQKLRLQVDLIGRGDAMRPARARRSKGS